MLFNSIDLYLQPGKNFPFDDDSERQQYLEDCHEAYEGDYGEIAFFQEQFKRCEEELNHWNTTLYRVLPINYHQEIIETTSNLVFNKLPQLNVEVNRDFYNLQKELLIDYLCYGIAVVHTFLENSVPKSVSVNPEFYYPIFNKMNTKQIVQDCIIYTVDNILYAEIHIPGFRESRAYNYKNGKIGSMIGQPSIIRTGLTESAISVVRRGNNSDNPYGASLFDKINIPLAQIFVSMTQINRILDKHVDPIQVIPESAIEYDEDGRAYYKIKNALVMGSKEDVLPQKITWDGKLESAFKNLDLWFRKLADISGLGPIILDTEQNVMAGLSGEAMRRLNSKAIATVNSIRDQFDVLIENILIKQSKLVNRNLTDLQIKWQDLFVDSENEKLDYVTKRLENGTMSQKEAIMYLDGVSEEEAIAKLQEINMNLPQDQIDLGGEL